MFAFAVADLLRIRSDVRAAQSELASFRDGRATSELSDEARDAAAKLRRAESRADNSPWLRLIAPIPVLHDQVQGVRDLTHAARQLGDLASGSADVLQRASDRASASPSARIALLDTAVSEIDRVDQGLASIDLGSRHGLLPPFSGARDTFRNLVTRTRERLQDSRGYVVAARRFLAGPSRYLVLAANNAEMTAGSGMPLSAGLADIVDGDIKVGEFTPTSDLWLGDKGVVAPGDLARLYSAMGIGFDFRGTTATPNFKVIGPILAEMAARHPALGHIDGVLVVDAIALQSMLSSTGPIVVEGNTYDAGNVVDEVLNRNYQRFASADSRGKRTELQSRIARAAFDALQHRHVSLQRLAIDLAHVAKGRHLLAWSADSDLEAMWDALGAGGGLVSDGVMVSAENYDGDKLDYYLQPRADLELDRNSDGSWAAELTVTITNSRRSNTSPYIEGFHPDHHYVFLDVHLPAAASDISLNGDGLTASDQGRDPPMTATVMIYPVELDETKTVSIDFRLPATTQRLTLLPSARLRPVVFTVNGTNQVTDATASSVMLRVHPVDYSADPYLLLGGILGVGAAGFALSAARGAEALSHTENTDRAQKRVRFDRRAAVVLGGLAAVALAVGLARLFL